MSANGAFQRDENFVPITTIGLQETKTITYVAGHLHPIDQDVIQTIATNTVTGGTLIYYCNWVPLSSDGNVTAA